MAAKDNTDLTDLTGLVEHITYCDEQSGFTVAQVSMRNRKLPVTVVGNLMAPAPGATLHMKGYWTLHQRFGRQFQVVQFDIQAPVTAQGIEKYLGSGLVKGIGPTMAGRIVAKFGTRTLDIIEHQIERLVEVDGIGSSRVKMILSAWNEQKEVRNVMLFLQSHGVSTTYGIKIFKQYGQNAISLVQKNPFRLADDIFGIGFITADRIADQLGFAKDSSVRIEAGILYVLHQLADEGHVYYPYEKLIDKAQTILKTQPQVIEKSLATLATDRRVIIEAINDAPEDPAAGTKAVYLGQFYHCETFVGQRLRMLSQSPLLWPEVDTRQALDWVQRRLGLDLAERQARALKMALRHKVLVITGGPGTGKTTIVQAITRIFENMQAAVLLAAPTGRAAKRLSEAAGRPAKTIHRLLEYHPGQGGFQRNESKPLDGELLVVDESSMMDTVLMYHLLKAVPLHTTLILVGDVNQLPSVGPGNVLKDIIASKTVPVVTLNQIFRQARTSNIVVNAHRINSGQMPRLADGNYRSDSDFYFIEQADAQRVLDIILTLTSERIPRRFGLDPVQDIQVLTPMHRGVLGADHLNLKLQQALNPQDVHIMFGDRCFRLGDKVMQIRNDYTKNVFNGDMGRIVDIDSAGRSLTARFEERNVVYTVADLDEIVLAYAVSVHKSQGSEYSAVVIPVATQHYVLLQRNLIYTAVTRGRQLAVLVGTRKALAMAIKNDTTHHRYTRLSHRLRLP